jgi:hypothetical protein
MAMPISWCRIASPVFAQSVIKGEDQMTPRNLLWCALMLLPCAGFAQDGCKPVTVLPRVIGSPGVYCLTQDLSTTVSASPAIQIVADNVTVDCGGHTITGTAGASTSAPGISATARKNVTVRDCTLKGFVTGIFLNGSGHLVEHNLLAGNYSTGIRVIGDNSTVRENQVVDTGGTTLALTSYGISTTKSVDILGNTVATVTGRAGSGIGAYGIYTSTNPSGVVADNRVRGLAADVGAANFGIFNAQATNVIVRGNSVSNLPNTTGYGLRCTGSGSVAVSNVIQGYSIPISGCKDAAGNIKP